MSWSIRFVCLRMERLIETDVWCVVDGRSREAGDLVEQGLAPLNHQQANHRKAGTQNTRRLQEHLGRSSPSRVGESGGY